MGGVLLPVLMMATIDNPRGVLYHGIEVAVFSIICLGIVIWGD